MISLGLPGESNLISLFQGQMISNMSEICKDPLCMWHNLFVGTTPGSERAAYHTVLRMQNENTGQ